jgi:hypothetical protein
MNHRTSYRVLTLLEVLLGSVDEFESNNLEATALEAGDDIANEGALDAIRLDHDVGALGVVRHSARRENRSAFWDSYATRRVEASRRDLLG